MEAPGSSRQTFAQVITDSTQDTIVLSRKEVPVQVGPHSCSDLKEISSNEPAVPSENAAVTVPMIVNTDLFYRVEERTIVILLRNWKGDQRQQRYRKIALRIAESLRLVARENVP